MIKAFLSSIFVIFLFTHLSAQQIIPFAFTSDDDNRLIKENDSVKFYVASGDTTNMVCINEDASSYHLYNKQHKLIAFGSFITEGDKFLQDGKWIENFDNGKTKIIGYYLHNMPVGTWQEFYDNGKVKMIANYAILKDDHGNMSSCLSGSYQEFYKSGKLKTDGFYVAVATLVADTIEVDDPVTGQKTYGIDKSTKYLPEKTSHWENYEENSPSEKKEED